METMHYAPGRTHNCSEVGFTSPTAAQSLMLRRSAPTRKSLKALTVLDGFGMARSFPLRARPSERRVARQAGPARILLSSKEAAWTYRVPPPGEAGSSSSTAGVVLAAIVLATIGLRGLKPAAPRVDRAAIWIDSVQRGPLVIEVRGPGTLVPERIRYISAVTAGRVERRLAEAGQEVKAETVLLELSNPDVQLEALESERQLTVSRADQVNLRANLSSQRLSQEAQVAGARAAYLDAKRNAEAAESLMAKQLISANEASRSRDQVEELATRYKVEQERLAVMTQAADSQISLQEAQVDRLRDVNQFQRGRVRSMVVMAGANGILQELPLEVGQWAQSGATLARIVEPGRLKAVLRIPETQAKDVTIGQPAAIDTRNGIVQGKVMRIDPGRAERHRDGGRLARGRAAPRRPARPLGGRHHPGRAARQRAARRAPGLRAAGQHGRAVQADPGRRRGRARARCASAARRSTRSRSSAASSRATR